MLFIPGRDLYAQSGPAAPRPGAPLAPPGPAPADRPGRAPAFVRWAFYGFMFSVPLEYPAREIPLEVHTITGAAFLLVCLLQPQVCFRPVPRAARWFAAYLVVYLARGCATEHPEDFLRIFLNLVQAYFLFWVAYNLMQDERTAKGALLAFAAAGSLLVVLVRAGLIEWGDEASRAEGRLTVLGQDPNVFAGNLMLTIVILLGLSYGLGRGTFRYPFLIWPLVALVGATATYTGSRGGFVALFAGLLVFAFRGGGAASVLRTVLITLVACGLCVAISLRTGSMWSRYARTLDEGNMSGRERIYPEAWGMVLESPVVGFGPTDCLYELGKRTGEDRLFRDPHNLVLELLISVGIVGAIPVFTCLALSGSAAWKARPGAAGVVPFALFATVLVLSMSISWLASKTAWLVMAYANAAAAATRPGTPTHRRLPPCAG